MKPTLVLRGTSFQPPLFCAPMAGLTHSAFRRLVSDFGGHGALFTEMLCGHWLLRENLGTSPSVKRRAADGPVFYQFMISDPADVPAIMDRIAGVSPSGIDLNCACPAPHIRNTGAGSELFEDAARLEAILRSMRQHHAGLLTVKIRLGSPRDGWRERLLDRFRLFENCGVDALILHPRFSDEKLRRRARHELLPELAAATRLPVIASGDIHGPQVIRDRPDWFAGMAGIMVGRMAVVRPWLFQEWKGNAVQPDFLEVWMRFVRYVQEDFPPPKVFYRVRAFTMYYARNFLFGHNLLASAQSSTNLEMLEERAMRFLSASPPLDPTPTVQGLA